MLRSICLLWVLSLGWASAQESLPDTESPAPKTSDESLQSIEELTQSSLQSVVVINHEGRNPGEGATGSGFIIDASGLIATNWHVINDRRRIEVELHDGTTHEVVSVHAWDRKLDLAVIRIKPSPESPLVPLALGDSDALVQGQSVIALGNPRGLKFSVAEGVVGALRDDIREGPFPLIQVSMPVEQGNSGGPLIDRDGKVQGIISLKSMVTANLGFAAPINALKLLMEKPNSMPMDRWATIGALDDRQWAPTMGALWTQRAGRIQVKGAGKGFGGRALCLSKRQLPADTYEVEVEVKLTDESGAAGLAFSSDGGQKHYGFYPSGGRIRLTRFDGPDVYSWNILEQLEVPEYNLGEWNRLRVQVSPDAINCFVNDTLVAKTEDDALRGGQVGLCKFRQTEAEFRNFRLADKIQVKELDPKLQAKLNEQIEGYLTGEGDSRQELLGAIMGDPLEGRASLEEVNAELQLRIDQLSRLSRDVQAEMIGREIHEVLSAEEVDLFHAGVLIAKVENPDLDVASYVELLDEMGAEIREGLGERPTEKQIIDATRRFMFQENGFHGSRLDYYNASNSYLNEVIDDREGIPITLSIVFMELARRAGAETVHGVNLPGHFVLAFQPKKDRMQLLDVFEGAKGLSKVEALRMVARMTGQLMTEEQLEEVSEREIILRMLRNLIAIKKGPDPMDAAAAGLEADPLAALPYLHVLLAVDPEDASARFDRAILRFQEGDRQGAKTDLRWLLQNEPPGVNIPRLREFYERL